MKNMKAPIQNNVANGVVRFPSSHRWGSFLGFAICALLAPLAWCDPQVAMPDFSLIGAKWGSSPHLWQSSKATVLPKQIAIDYTPKGTVYGFVRQYEAATNTFETLKREIQSEVRVPVKVMGPKLLVWRVAERRFSVMLEFHEDEQKINLIVTSIDKDIRSED